MTADLAAAYTSGSQRARVVTEGWGEHNLYCANCSSPNLERLGHNTKANDFACPSCKVWYQLKGQKSRIGNSVSDGGYEAMMSAIHNEQTPNFYFLHYDLATWTIQNLLLIPSFAFPASAIIKRNPLRPTARRAGWIGCNIALHRIPLEARIPLVRDRQPIPAADVRTRYQRLKPLQQVGVEKRGWTLEVLNLIHQLGKPRFTNADLYAHAETFKRLHPGNHNIQAKIRQQLQILRDTGFIHPLARGHWTLTPATPSGYDSVPVLKSQRD